MKTEKDKKKRAMEGKKKQCIRILIADDHSVVREGLVSLVKRKSDMTVVAEANNGREAVDLWKEHRPDVILLDLRMPELDGVGAIKEIRGLDESAHIVVLTTFDGDEDIYRAIKAGAKGYLLKDTAREALMECIRRVHAGETCIPPSLAAKLADRVSGEALSAREIEVLQRVAAGKSNKEIGAELFISEGTVKTHVKSIFSKLDVVSRTEAVATASRRGLIQL
jgi:two-component system NarL family response regulator